MTLTVIIRWFDGAVNYKKKSNQLQNMTMSRAFSLPLEYLTTAGFFQTLFLVHTLQHTCNYNTLVIF